MGESEECIHLQMKCTSDTVVNPLVNQYYKKPLGGGFQVLFNYWLNLTHSSFRIQSQKPWTETYFPETFDLFHSATLDLFFHTFPKEQAKRLMDCTF